MVKLTLKYGLPFCQVILAYQGESLVLNNVLVDTGSGGSVFKMDKVDELGLTIEKDDIIETISGVGGSEFIFKKNVDKIKLGKSEITDFKIEVGVMDYGFEIDGILGMDFLQKTGAVIDLAKMQITVANGGKRLG